MSKLFKTVAIVNAIGWLAGGISFGTIGPNGSMDTTAVIAALAMTGNLIAAAYAAASEAVKQ